MVEGSKLHLKMYLVHREPVYDLIKRIEENYDDSVAGLVVPVNSGLKKGYARKVLKDAGLDIDRAEQLKDGERRFRYGRRSLQILEKRGEDVAQTVIDQHLEGRMFLGITGDDLYDEHMLRNPEHTLRLVNTYDWIDENARFHRPTLCLINRTGKPGDIPSEAKVGVNNKYQRTSELYLQRSGHFTKKRYEVVGYGGDLEQTVSAGPNDCCIEIVYTGSTLDQHRLKIVEIIRASDLVVISPLGSNGRNGKE